MCGHTGQKESYVRVFEFEDQCCDRISIQGPELGRNTDRIEGATGEDMSDVGVRVEGIDGQDLQVRDGRTT